MSEGTVYYLIGLDAHSQWCRVGQWEADGRRVWPIKDKAQAITKAVEFKSSMAGTGWQDAMLERVVSTFIPIELDTEE